MSDVRVASRYANALFAVAKENSVVESVSDDLSAISHALDNDPAFRDLIHNPGFKRDQKLQVLEAVFSDRVTALTMQLIRVLLDRRREVLLPNVQAEFDEIRRREGGIAYVEVTSAEEMTDAERESVISKIASATGKTVEATFEIDKSILGGIKVQVGNYVLDGSVAGGLSRLRDRMTYDLLKQI